MSDVSRIALVVKSQYFFHFSTLIKLWAQKMSEIVSCLWLYKNYCKNRKFSAAFYLVFEHKIFCTIFAFGRTPENCPLIRKKSVTTVFFLVCLLTHRWKPFWTRLRNKRDFAVLKQVSHATIDRFLAIWSPGRLAESSARALLILGRSFAF
jgi:hypothetical protein